MIRAQSVENTQTHSTSQTTNVWRRKRSEDKLSGREFSKNRAESLRWASLFQVAFRAEQSGSLSGLSGKIHRTAVCLSLNPTFFFFYGNFLHWEKFRSLNLLFAKFSEKINVCALRYVSILQSVLTNPAWNDPAVQILTRWAGCSGPELEMCPVSGLCCEKYSAFPHSTLDRRYWLRLDQHRTTRFSLQDSCSKRSRVHLCSLKR